MIVDILQNQMTDKHIELVFALPGVVADFFLSEKVFLSPMSYSTPCWGEPLQSVSYLMLTLSNALY